MKKIQWKWTSLLVLIASLPAIIHAQGKIRPIPEPRPMPMPPRIVLQDRNLKPIKISSVNATVTIHGCAAETEMTMVFFNPNGRQLAGTLYCPLPEGAVISGYGLDVGGKLVDGVVVGRDKARQVFETEMRKNVDPGLVESVKGNNFKTRVYPIPPNGTRTVMVRYLTELEVTDGAPTFTLPLNFKDALETFKLKVTIAEGTVQPKVTGGPGNVTFKAWERQLVAEKTYKNLSLTEDLVIAIPKQDRRPISVEKADDGIFLAVDCTPASPKSGAKGPAAQWKTVTLFWDASASRAMADHEAEFEFLRQLFAKRNASTTVNLVVFRNVPEPPLEFTIKKDPKKLIDFLKSIYFDGGTQMGALTLPQGKQDAVLMFTDGISNFGKADPAAALTCPVYAFSSTSTTEYDFLRYLARTTGGQYHNLKGTKTDAVVDALFTAQPTVFVGAELNGKALAEAYPAPNTAITRAGAAFRFAAKLPADAKASKLTLTFKIDGKTVPMTLEVDPAKATDGNVLRTFFGRMKINELLVFKKKNETALVDAGKTYGMVTPGTSLLVLETLDQYVQHRVVPPKSLPQMRQQYYDRIEAQGKATQQAEFKRMDEVIAMWTEVCNWHNKDFTFNLEALRKRKDRREGRDRVRASMGNADAGSAAERISPADVSDDAPQTDDFSLGAAGSPRSEAYVAKEKKKGGSYAAASISIKAWKPDTPYLKVLERTGDKAYAQYLDMRKEYGNAPSYYLDCADFFINNGQKSLGLRVLSNVAEMELENAALLRVLAHRLAQIEQLELAAMTFDEVLRLRPEEPQSMRDLALVLGDLKQYDRAITLLYDMALKRWQRFQDIEKIALVEMNRLIAKATHEGVKLTVTVDTRLVTLIDVDVRIVMTWDADMTDMDLWVTEPSMERCYYGHNRTAIGGRMSRDFTQGYGPEEYMLKKSPNGEFVIETNFFGSSAQSVIGAVTLQATVYTNYGRPDEKRQALTFRLSKNKEKITLGKVTIGKDGKATVGGGRDYQIKKGDTLYSIAKEQLGDAKRWEEIVKANPGLDPNKLKVGTIITLPTK